jgi:hypothetical protein
VSVAGTVHERCRTPVSVAGTVHERCCTPVSVAGTVFFAGPGEDIVGGPAVLDSVESTVTPTELGTHLSHRCLGMCHARV